MLYVDDRAGSNTLARHIEPQSLVSLGRFNADVEFLGFGPQHMPIPIGIEYKKIDDLLKCMIDGRFTGTQLPAMKKCYERCYLLVEGSYRPNPESGVLQTRRYDRKKRAWGWQDDRFTYQQLDSYLNTLAERAGIRIMRSFDVKESAKMVMDLYRWWTAKDYEDHRSHLQPDMSQLPSKVQPDNPMFLTEDASLLRMWASHLPGVGWKKAEHIERHFGSAREMANATEEEWQQVQWKSKSGRNNGIGPITAKKIIDEVTKEIS